MLRRQMLERLFAQHRVLELFLVFCCAVSVIYNGSLTLELTSGARRIEHNVECGFVQNGTHVISSSRCSTVPCPSHIKALGATLAALLFCYLGAAVSFYSSNELKDFGLLERIVITLGLNGSILFGFINCYDIFNDMTDIEIMFERIILIVFTFITCTFILQKAVNSYYYGFKIRCIIQIYDILLNLFFILVIRVLMELTNSKVLGEYIIVTLILQCTALFTNSLHLFLICFFNVKMIVVRKIVETSEFAVTIEY